MLNILLLLLPLLGAEVTGHAQSLKRSDLPDAVPLQIFQEGFAVLEVQLFNESSEDWVFDPATVELRSPRGKRLKQVAPTDLTPKLIKYYRRDSSTQARAHAEIGYGRPLPSGAQPAPTTLGSGGRAGELSVDTAQRLRSALEDNRLAKTVLGPGENAQGLLYFKSKDSGSKLTGSILKLENGISIEVQ